MYSINTDIGSNFIIDLEKVVFAGLIIKNSKPVIWISFGDTDLELLYYSKEAAIKELELLNEYLTRVGR